MPTLFDRMLLRECLAPLGVGLLAILQLLVLAQLLQLNEVVFGGAITLLDLGRVTVGLFPHFLALASPLAFVLAVQLSLGRMAGDRELLALCAAGRSPLAFYRVPALLACAVAGGSFWLTAVAEPWGLRELNGVLEQVIKRTLAEALQPGVFNTGLPRFMVYVERGAQGLDRGAWNGILIEDSVGSGAPLLVLAESGRLVNQGGDAFAVELGPGELHRAEEHGETVARFQSASIVVNVAERIARKNRFSDVDAMFTDEELRQRAVRFEAEGRPDRARRSHLQRAVRVASPLAVLSFLLLAVPLAVLGAGSRGLAYLTVVLSFATFYTFQRVALVLAERGAPAWAMAFLPNAIVATIGLALSVRLLRRGVRS